jgi:hypothetical protein
LYWFILLYSHFSIYFHVFQYTQGGLKATKVWKHVAVYKKCLILIMQQKGCRSDVKNYINFIFLKLPIDMKTLVTSQWRSKVTPGPGARLLYGDPPVLKKNCKKLRVCIFNEIEIPLFYILYLFYISSPLANITNVPCIIENSCFWRKDDIILHAICQNSSFELYFHQNFL